jgi:septal ring factor EnvC (AmiA/AmiB activator)
LGFLLLFSLTIHAQNNRSKLEKEKQESIRKIKETEKIIKETKSQKRATMGQLSALSKQIEARQELINSITEEIRMLDEEIEEDELVISALEGDLEALRKEYGAMIFAASKMNNSYYKLAFIFSAESINQMIMRLKYFQQYSEMRKNQLELIDKVKNSIEKERATLNRKRNEKNELLTNQTQETSNLNSIKEEKNKVFRELSKKEKALRKELEETKKSLKQLENKIREVIEEERRRAIAAAEKAAKEKSKAAAAELKESKEMTSSFGGNQNKLPWPVSNGSVVRKYGRQKHPVLGIEEINLGIGIQTVKGEEVRAVFPGKVINITEIPGMNKIVMIQHGEYITVYGRLKKVYVKKDQEVSAKEAIGEVYTNKEDDSLLEFQIWKGNTHLDPEAWLGNKR